MLIGCRFNVNVCKYSLHVQIVPYLVGVEYVGMPIIKEIGPIVLA